MALTISPRTLSLKRKKRPGTSDPRTVRIKRLESQLAGEREYVNMLANTIAEVARERDDAEGKYTQLRRMYALLGRDWDRMAETMVANIRRREGVYEALSSVVRSASTAMDSYDDGETVRHHLRRAWALFTADVRNLLGLRVNNSRYDQLTRRQLRALYDQLVALRRIADTMREEFAVAEEVRRMDGRSRADVGVK